MKGSNKVEQKQFGIGLDIVVETDLTAEEFNDKFIEWVESNGWTCGGSMFAVDEEGMRISKRKDVKDNK